MRIIESEEDVFMNKKYKCINSFILKMIAIITMVIDHVGAVLFPMNMMFRYIGRISFPLFVFLLVEVFIPEKFENTN